MLGRLRPKRGDDNAADPDAIRAREQSEIIKEPPMEIVGKVFQPDEFVRYVEGLDFAEPRPTRVFLHHTWRPTIEQWRGKETIYGMKAYYERQIWEDLDGRLHEGWNAGPHLFVAPDGIWVFSDLRYDGVGVRGHNTATRHLEMVGDYDEKLPSGPILEYSIAALGILHVRLGLDAANLNFHRDYSTKTCPGKAVQKSWIIPQVQAWIKAYRERKLAELGEVRSALVRLIQDLMVPTNPHAALAQGAEERGLLGALTHEIPIEIDDRGYIIQLYGEALIVPADDWDKVMTLDEFERQEMGVRRQAPATRVVGGQVRELAMNPKAPIPGEGSMR